MAAGHAVGVMPEAILDQFAGKLPGYLISMDYV